VAALDKLLQVGESSKYLSVNFVTFLIACEIVVFPHHVLNDGAELHHALLHRYHKTVHLGEHLVFVLAVGDNLACLGVASVEVVLHKPHFSDTFPL